MIHIIPILYVLHIKFLKCKKMIPLEPISAVDGNVNKLGPTIYEEDCRSVSLHWRLRY